MAQPVSRAQLESMRAASFAYRAQLSDVTGGSLIRGLSAQAPSGAVQANYSDGEYQLFALFQNLAVPIGDDYYQGWLVRPEPFGFVSLGNLTYVDGVFVQAYRSKQDLTPYTGYVVTLEANDANPAPADHILQGTLTVTDATQ